MINEATAQAKELVTLPFSLHTFGDFANDTNWIGMTPDGNQYIFAVFDKRSDVWLIENFDPEVK